MIFNLSEIEQSRGVGELRYSSKMASTSDEAKRIVRSGEEVRFPLLFLCEKQTAGRGQRGNSWFSDRDSLTFTWCIEQKTVAAELQPILPLLAGKCVCDSFLGLGVNGAKLKWPNDVLINRQKVCGILVEQVQTKEPVFLIGIGVNVRQSSIESANTDPAKSHFPPTSLRQQSQQEDIGQHELLMSIVGQLDQRIGGSESLQISDLQTEFDFLGERIRFVLPKGSEIHGVFRGVDENGFALIDRNGTIDRHASGHLLPV